MQLPGSQKKSPPGDAKPRGSEYSPQLVRLGILGVVLVVCLLAWQWWSSPVPDQSAGVVVNPARGSVPLDQKEFDRGRELSQQICGTCHLYPEPGLLDKFSWSMETLPKMALWLGFARNTNYEDPSGRIKEAKLIPKEPLFRYEDWAAICNYYISAAPGTLPPQPATPPIKIGLKQFAVEIPKYDRPAKNLMIRLDESSGLIYVGNDDKSTLDVLDRNFQRIADISLPSTPVNLKFTPEGMFLTLIGSFLPTDVPAGQLLFMNKPGKGTNASQEVFKGLQRPVDMQVADFNGDGRRDFLICEFGNWLGRLSWQENFGDGNFKVHDILDRPGAIQAEVGDFNGDGKPDIIVMMTQAREGIYLLLNDGKGNFSSQPIVEYPPTWGCAGFQLVDFNHDGRLDILAVNGDNGDTHDYPSPLKPYHGIRLYLNQGNNTYREAFFYPLNGAYKAIPRDFDGDGDLDIIAISYYPDFHNRRTESCMYLENTGNGKFDAYSFAEAISGHWLNMDVGDVDGDGDLDVLLCSHIGGPGPVPTVLMNEWEKRGSSLLLLRNVLRK